MKKVSNKYVNFGIAFALLGILVFSLIMTPLEGFKEAADEPETEEKTETTTKKKIANIDTKKIQKMLDDLSNNISDSKEGFSYINEPLSQVQHLGHLLKDEKEQSKLV
jgi:hypothetical protein